jgi:hypothetical protein
MIEGNIVEALVIHLLPSPQRSPQFSLLRLGGPSGYRSSSPTFRGPKLKQGGEEKAFFGMSAPHSYRGIVS